MQRSYWKNFTAYYELDTDCSNNKRFNFQMINSFHKWVKYDCPGERSPE